MESISKSFLDSLIGLPLKEAMKKGKKAGLVVFGPGTRVLAAYLNGVTLECDYPDLMTPVVKSYRLDFPEQLDKGQDGAEEIV